MSAIQSTLMPVESAMPLAAPLPQVAPRAGAVQVDPRTAAVELEGLFVSLLLQQMRQTVGGEGMFPGDASDTYGGLFDLYLGRQLAESGALGVGDMVAKYLEADRQP